MSVRIAIALVLSAAASGACAQRDTADLSALISCSAYEASGLSSGACRLEANGEALLVEFAAPNDVGVVAVRVIGDAGQVRQVLMEEHVDQHIAPYIQDIDGDGRADIVLPRSRGNVNAVSALWLFSDEGFYRRLGEVSGYDFTRAEDGLLKVSSRSSASQHNVAYLAMNEGALQLVASVDIELMEDGAPRACVLADAPGIAELALTTEEAQTRFCNAAAEAEHE